MILATTSNLCLMTDKWLHDPNLSDNNGMTVAMIAASIGKINDIPM